MIPVITGDRYDSPQGIKSCLREYLMLKSRWSPYSKFIQIIFKYRPLAVRGEYTDEIWAQSSLEVMEKLETCGARFHISGLDQVRALDGPCVFVSNHMSTLETLLLPGLIVPIQPCTFVVKDSLLNGKVWGPVMRSRNPIAVGRKDPRKDLETVITEGTRILGEGRSIIIFPQSTRAAKFSRKQFNSLGAKLAARTGVNLMPVAIKTDYWSNGKFIRLFGPVHRERAIHVEFGPAMKVEGRGKAEHEACVKFIEDRLTSWGGEIDSES